MREKDVKNISELFAKALKRVEKRIRATKKGKEEVEQVFSLLQKHLSLSPEDAPTGYWTDSSFSLKWWKYSKWDNTYYTYEEKHKIGYKNGKVVVRGEETGNIYESLPASIASIRYDEFADTVIEFIKKVADDLKLWDEEIRKIENLRKILEEA